MRRACLYAGGALTPRMNYCVNLIMIKGGLFKSRYKYAGTLDTEILRRYHFQGAKGYALCRDFHLHYL